MVLEMLVRVLRQSVDACRSEQLSRASKKWLVDSNAALEDRVYLTMNISVVSLPTSGLNSTGNSGSYLNGQNMTPDGQFAIFHSHASDLGVNDTNSKKDVYWKNLATGETRLVSSSSTGIQSNGDSTPDAISDNGRYVVFHSNATNLDPADTDTVWDVYLKDMVTGQLTLVSTSSTGVKGNQNCISSSENTPEGPQYLSGADVSGDGRFVVFDSRATNLVSGDSNGQSDVFLKDLLTGQTSSATNAFGGIPSGGSFLPRITPDAKWAFFLSWSGDIVSGDSNGTWDLFRKNLTTGETLCVSTNEFGQIGDGESAWDYDFSPDGNLVVFTSTSSNLVGGDSNGTRDAFLKNLSTGSIRRISTDSFGQQVNATFWINQNMSSDSRYVVLWSPDPGVVSNDTNGTDDVFLKDTVTGSMIRISQTQTGGETNGPSHHGNISDDGRRVIFQSLGSNVVSGDNNANVDVFMWQNTPPVAANDSFSTAANTPVVGVSSLIVSNDTDVDGQILQPVLISGPLHGSILVQSDGSWIYQPNAGYSGSDQFTYKASDGPDLGNMATVSISIQNNNPTNLTLSNSSVPENNAIGTSVGTLGTADPDLGNSFTYSLVAGNGSADNGSFSIVGNVLKTAAAFDFEAKSSFSIRLRTTDQGGLWFEKAFTILVTNSNETPTNISLSNSTVSENSAIGTSVGTLDSSDPDLGNSFSYSLVAGNGSTDNGSFNIVGNVLNTASVINFEAKSSYSIRIRTTDQNGSTYEKVFSLTATNTNDAPELSDAGSPMLDAIAQDISDSANTGTLVSTIISRMLPNGGITDEDTGALNGIAINGLTGTSNGSWQFSINNGVTWSAVATTGNTNARLLASDANTRIRYVPNTGFSGQASFAFVAWDRTSGANGGVANTSSRGGTTPFSVIYDYASILVNGPPTNIVL